MAEGLLTILKLCLLAMLYLFFLRLLRAVWVEVNGPRLRGAHAQNKPLPAPPTSRADKRSARKAGGSKGPSLVVVAPEALRGGVYPIENEIAMGRAASCRITFEDTYVSQMHARVFAADGRLYVEDLGSTNGTYLNRSKVTGRLLLAAGDQIQVGSTVLEFVP